MKTWITSEAPLLKAWSILLILVLPRLYIRNSSIDQYIFWTLMLFLLPISIRYIRGNKIQTRKPLIKKEKWECGATFGDRG